MLHLYISSCSCRVLHKKGWCNGNRVHSREHIQDGKSTIPARTTIPARPRTTPKKKQRQDQEQQQDSLLYEDQDVFEDLDLFLSSLINTPVHVPDVHPSTSFPPSAAKEEEQNNSSTSVSTCKRYLPHTEPITPTKNPRIKKHRSFPLPPLPPYKGN